ncbi:hypothetical protein [Inquilinus limosus]|uniref:hypothetical protein n=1 Tax=Inquilinus limosus TaxID=171674 RepID=UPI00126A0BE1|nr:hypothetical protein [Inquilinus limosus]
MSAEPLILGLHNKIEDMNFTFWESKIDRGSISPNFAKNIPASDFIVFTIHHEAGGGADGFVSYWCGLDGTRGFGVRFIWKSRTDDHRIEVKGQALAGIINEGTWIYTKSKTLSLVSEESHHNQVLSFYIKQTAAHEPWHEIVEDNTFHERWIGDIGIGIPGR